ncbi:hypothetical protein NM208_g5312 [Fusarium decemcellulare]|uniref:Uncharacterized protein n=1 Tax=Fusarium decemcellulare TaxID=57161 RepID=A0ACC1SHF3_9HYPO|nr:hypothetical protein NM208_g5312 [Fusarium decemcellulare]
MALGRRQDASAPRSRAENVTDVNRRYCGKPLQVACQAKVVLQCDRRQPCAHCMRRGKTVSVLVFSRHHLLRKQDACIYEVDADRVPYAPIPTQLQDKPMNGVPQNCLEPTPATSSVVQDEFRVLGYGDDAKGTLGVLRNLGESASLLHHSQPRNGSASSQYASIVRELPSRRHMDILVQDFFKNVAWHYDIVDEAAFTHQLSEWSRLTHNQLKQGPDALPINLRSFPALLFQVLAQGLLFQPTQHDESLNDLKYTADMELSDRAADYSEAGHRLASSFRKSELTLTIVQAELMRACFEKTTGAVIEAWHTLGVAIRDAQELGLHLVGPEQTVYLRAEKPSDRELGRNVWFMLHLWDAHMAIVLGRPMSTRMSANDVPLPMSSRDSSGAPKPPQPRDVILCGYHTAYKFLQDIHDLEKMEDWRTLVDSIHDTILTNIANLPAWATAQRSRQGEPRWLSSALEIMNTNIHFVVFALHRPFVFADPGSRRKAFHSAMQILEAQTRLFDQTEPLQYKAFSLVFATFDAMVLIAAVHIRFPNELREQFPATERNLEWGLSRLNYLQARNNHLATSAFNIIQRLYRKMLAVMFPMQSLTPHHADSESGNSVGMEAEMVGVSWENTLQYDLGDVFPPQPLNELLCGGYFNETEFGPDFFDSLGNDLITDTNASETTNRDK